MILYVTEDALAQLEEIWVWNAKKYGVGRANKYKDFLESETRKLLDGCLHARKVTLRPEYSYVLAQKGRGRSHGHAIVFKVNGDVLEVLFYFHTSQDWQSHLDP